MLKPKILIPAFLVLAGLGIAGYFILRGGGAPTLLLKAERRDVVQVVTVTGTVKAASTINLEFLTNGRVVSRPVSAGSRVARGQVLMALETGDLDIQIAKADALVKGNQAKIDQLKAGATPETLRQSENALTAAYIQALPALDTALTKADKALAILRADVFLQNNTVRTDFSLPADSFTGQAESDKQAAEAAIADLHNLRSAIAVGAFNSALLGNLYLRAAPQLDTVRVVLVDSSGLLRRVVSPTISQTTLNTYLTDVAGVRSEFDTAVTAFGTAIANIQSARDALQLKQEPPRQVDLAVLEANLQSTMADLQLLQKQKSDAILVAPVDGIVTDVGYEIGEIGRVNSTAVSMISTSGIDIEANIPEVDIAKIVLGNTVAITLDALPGENFSGRVTHVDPAETIVDGVTNYKVKMSFDSRDPRIKTGATANLEIETLRKSGVLTLPQIAIVENDLGTFVRKVQNGKEVEVAVMLGVRSSDGYIEVLSGVAEGEEVLNTGLKTGN